MPIRTRHDAKNKRNQHSTGEKRRTVRQSRTDPAKEGRRNREKEGHGSLFETVPVEMLSPSPENIDIYGQVLSDDPETIKLATDIKAKGRLLEHIVVTADGVVVSGHRRLAACLQLGWTHVPIERLARTRESYSIDAFKKLLASYNLHRNKTFTQKALEEIARMNPDEARLMLIEERKKSRAKMPESLDIGTARERAKVSKNRKLFLDAILKIIGEMKEYLPLTDRACHYLLLNDPPLIHSGKPDSIYKNDARSYKQLTKLLVQARVEDLIPYNAFHDPHRISVAWNVVSDASVFMTQTLNELFQGYWRDLLQSQPHHYEILGEKQTIDSIISPVAAKYCCPYSIAKGYGSLHSRYLVAERFRKSGKDKLVLLALSDHDPEGEDLIRAFARSLNKDMGIAEQRIRIVKVALNHEHIKQYKLQPNHEAKVTSSRAEKFRQEHGDYTYELESIPPAELQKLLRNALDREIDLDRFNAEYKTEAEEAARFDQLRKQIKAIMPDLLRDEDDCDPGN